MYNGMATYIVAYTHIVAGDNLCRTLGTYCRPKAYIIGDKICRYSCFCQANGATIYAKSCRRRQNMPSIFFYKRQLWWFILYIYWNDNEVSTYRGLIFCRKICDHQNNWGWGIVRKSLDIQTASMNTELFLSVISAVKTSPRFSNSTCVHVSLKWGHSFTVVMADASRVR